LARIKLFIPLFIFLVLASLLYWGLGRDPSAMPSALVGRSVPPFKLPALADDTRILDESLFRGQVSLLNVWATWCPSCRVEHPFLLELARQGVTIIGLDYKDERDKALTWLSNLGDPYQQVIFDARGSLGLDLGVFGAPETYLIDDEGRIRFKRVGVVDEQVWERELAPRYRALLAGETPPIESGPP